MQYAAEKGHEVRTAIILTGGLFKSDRAKTAHGLIRHGRRFDILAVVDPPLAGRDAAKLLRVEKSHPVPIVSHVDQAPRADFLIIGVAPPGGRLPQNWKGEIDRALIRGMNLVSGLHEFLGEDPHFCALASKVGASIWDVRRPPANLTCFRGGFESKCPVVLTVGTEAAVGKRTTAVCLVRLAQRQGLDVGFLATGQTGIMIGCDEGVVADRLPADFISGEIEKRVKWLSNRNKDLIIVEGNGALSHPAYGPVAHGILVGSHASHMIICHDPSMKNRGSYPELPMPTVKDELSIIEMISKPELLGISLRTKGLKGWKATIENHRTRFDVPALDPVRQSSAPFLKGLGLWDLGLGKIKGSLKKK